MIHSPELPILQNRWNRKVKGEWAEIVFMLEAHRRGFIVSRPWGESAAYDLIVESKRGLFRVQVKSIWTKYNGCDGYSVMLKRCLRPYLPGEIDLVAAYIVPERAWYILPFRALDGATIVILYPHKAHSRGKREKFRENWRIFGQDSQMW